MPTQIYIFRVCRTFLSALALGLWLAPTQSLATDTKPAPSKARPSFADFVKARQKEAQEKKPPNPLKGWTLAVGAQHSNSRRTDTVAPSHNGSNTYSLTATKPLDRQTTVGGSLAFNRGVARTSADTGETETRVVSAALFGMKDLGNGVLVDASLARGNVDLNNAHTSSGQVTFQTDSTFYAAGVGVTKIIPLSKTVVITSSGHYTYSYSDSNGYQDSTSAITPGATSTKSTFSVGGGVYWTLDKWRPNAKLNLNHTTAPLYNGTTDQTYFTYALGTSYALEADLKVSVGVTGSLGKAQTRDRGLMCTISRTF